MVALQINIRKEDKEQVLALLKSSELIREIIELTQRETYYDSTKTSFTFEDIEAIAAQFPADKKWTYTEVCEVFPPDLSVKLEIINNRLIIMPAPSILHQKISNRLSNRLTNFVEEHELGDVLVAPTDVKFDESNVEQPDILFISIKRNQIVKANAIHGAPNLVVEILSPSNYKNKKEIEEKRALYENEGVEEYWEISPKDRYVKVEVLEEGKYQVFSEVVEQGTVYSSVLEGFEIKLEELMPEKFFI